MAEVETCSLKEGYVAKRDKIGQHKQWYSQGDFHTVSIIQGAPCTINFGSAGS